MEEAFTNVVEHIFTNWTALNLAISNSDLDSKTLGNLVAECKSYMVQYCLYSANVDVNNIEEALDDIMDQEFDTICEDGSTKEIAILLERFLQLARQDDIEKFNAEFSKLPISTTTSFCPTPNSNSSEHKTENVGEISYECETPMDEDSDWTEVKSRRKK